MAGLLSGLRNGYSSRNTVRCKQGEGRPPKAIKKSRQVGGGRGSGADEADSSKDAAARPAAMKAAGKLKSTTEAKMAAAPKGRTRKTVAYEESDEESVDESEEEVKAVPSAAERFRQAEAEINRLSGSEMELREEIVHVREQFTAFKRGLRELCGSEEDIAETIGPEKKQKTLAPSASEKATPAAAVARKGATSQEAAASKEAPTSKKAAALKKKATKTRAPRAAPAAAIASKGKTAAQAASKVIFPNLKPASMIAGSALSDDESEDDRDVNSTFISEVPEGSLDEGAGALRQDQAALKQRGARARRG